MADNDVTDLIRLDDDGNCDHLWMDEFLVVFCFYCGTPRASMSHASQGHGDGASLGGEAAPTYTEADHEARRAHPDHQSAE